MTVLSCSSDTLIHTPSLSHLHTCTYTVHFNTHINMSFCLPHINIHTWNMLSSSLPLFSSLLPLCPCTRLLQRLCGFIRCVVDLLWDISYYYWLDLASSVSFSNQEASMMDFSVFTVCTFFLTFVPFVMHKNSRRTILFYYMYTNKLFRSGKWKRWCQVKVGGSVSQVVWHQLLQQPNVEYCCFPTVGRLTTTKQKHQIFACVRDWFGGWCDEKSKWETAEGQSEHILQGRWSKKLQFCCPLLCVLIGMCSLWEI